MLVEDDADLRDGWSELFDLMDFQYSTYLRGADALDDLESLRNCDVLVTDYYLPDLNGVEVVKNARKVNENVGAILLTGSKEKSVVESIAALSNCVLLHKPINVDVLEAELLKFFAKRNLA